MCVNVKSALSEGDFIPEPKRKISNPQQPFSLFCCCTSVIPPVTLFFYSLLSALPGTGSSVPEVNGVQEPSLAKRLRGTPERIELENYRLSLQREEELEEVPEETLAEHNLSSVLDKATDADLGSR